jgi:two-component system chemotaxis response regulator CheB
VRPLEQIRGQVDAIAIGTSAGGVDALSLVLPALPADLQTSVFIVLHLPRERPSLLVEIFQPKCAARICEAEDKEPVRPGTVYFAPPDYHLLIEPGPQLALSADEPVHFSRPSVDVLFESAADVYRDRLLGVLLTGASEDGANGLAAIRRAGGWTIAQRADTALAPQMVEAAIADGSAGYVVTLGELARLFKDGLRP